MCSQPLAWCPWIQQTGRGSGPGWGRESYPDVFAHSFRQARNTAETNKRLDSIVPKQAKETATRTVSRPAQVWAV